MEGRKLRCRPGDLVIVIDPADAPEFLGRIFRVTARCPVHPDSWDTDPPQYVPGYLLPASFHDRTLQPIRPDESPESITTDEPVEVVA